MLMLASSRTPSAANIGAPLRENPPGGENWRPRSPRKSDGIGGPAGDFVGLAVGPHADDGVEGTLPQLGDVDPLDGDAELVHDVLQEVVGHRSLGDDSLESEGDRRGLDGADPDGEEPTAV